MCQFAKAYPLRALQSFIETDAKLIAPSVERIADEVRYLNDAQFTQEPLAQIHNVARTVSDIYRMEIKDIESVFMASPVARTNWASHVIMLNSSIPLGVSYWYMKQSVEMGWSSNVLKIQIETNLYSRQISNNKVNNFTTTLPAPQSDLANYLLKDPYIFDLAGTKEKADERDIEEQLVKHVTCYLLEMGNGFAFVARQKHFQVGNSDFYADLILYSIPLHAYIVVELKIGEFQPEYKGKMEFYLNILNDTVKLPHENPAIGIIICKSKSRMIVEYALKSSNMPIGVATYSLSSELPEAYKKLLPTSEEIAKKIELLIER